MENENNEVVEQQVEQGNEGTPAPEAPAQDTPPAPLNQDNYVERAKAALERAGKKQSISTTPPPGQTQRGADGKFLPKTGEKAPAAPKAPEAPKAAGDAAGAAGQPGEEEKTPAAAFTPNPKFSALGKDYELPKWLAETVQSAEQEQEIKDIYSKAMGLDHVKMRHQELFTKHTDLTNNHNELVGGLQEMKGIYTHAVQSGNFLLLDDFFSKMQIPEQIVLQYALQKAQYLELQEQNPSAKAAVDQALQTQRRAYTLEQQNQALQQGSSSAQSQAIATQIDNAVASPNVAPIAQAFDSAPGRKPGDFREQVRQHGEYRFYASKGQVLLPPEQAAQEVIAKFGLTPQAAAALAPAPGAQPPAPAAAAPQGAAQPPAPAPHRNVPTIPAVNGRTGASPLKTKPRSIADLKKLSNEMNSG